MMGINSDFDGWLQGPFAFIIFDKTFGRIVAARDPK